LNAILRNSGLEVISLQETRTANIELNNYEVVYAKPSKVERGNDGLKYNASMAIKTTLRYELLTQTEDIVGVIIDLET
jgi:hypothetical protein